MREKLQEFRDVLGRFEEKMAEKVYSHLPDYLKLLQQLLAKLNTASLRDLTKL